MFGVPSKPPSPVPTFGGNPTSIKVGAYRWDAWWIPTETNVRQAIEASLGPSYYHWRAPWFATEPTPSSISISGQQTDMDADIEYAKAAGVDYWIYGWYSATDPMQQAWVYHQNSPNKNDVNWCINWLGYFNLIQDATNNAATIASYAAQSNYQKVLGGRPLFYIFDDNSSDQTGVSAAVSAIRSACISAGLANPYFVLEQGNLSLSRITGIGCDCVTKYAISEVVNQQPMSRLTSFIRTYYTKLLAVGIDVIPNVMLGHDRRPRIENVPFWQISVVDFMTNFYFPEFETDFAVAIDNALAFVRANSSACPANTIVIYGWNEHDEGGWISPTFTQGGPSTSRVAMLAKLLKP